MVAETTRAFGWALPWVLLCCVSPLPCEAGYTITGLGNLGGPGSVAYGMNDHGEIVGDSFATDGKKHAFLYTNGMMNDLGTFGGTERRADRFRLVAYPSARGCVAAYFPEANALVHRELLARESNTPGFKAMAVR